MTSPDGSVTIRLLANVQGYVSNIRQAAQTTKDFGSELSKAAKAEKLDALASSATKVGIAAVAAFGLVVKAGADFEQAMSRAAAGTQATGAELGSLRQAAIQAGQATKYSATDAAEGITALGKAGLSTSDILRGGLTGALSLASAGELAVGEAAEDTASALAQFNLSGGQASHVADLLAAGAGKAQGDVSDLALALKQSGLVAAQTGLSIEETTGSLAAFANAGLIGQDAGTSFKQMLLSLANPTGKAKDLLDEYNISAFDAQGQFVGMANFAGQLHDKLAGLTDQQREAALATIFGSDAIRAASVLYSEGSQGIQDWTDKVNDAGYAADQAGKLQDNLRGDVEKLTGSFETLFITSESGANGALRGIVQTFTNMTNAVGGLPGPVQTAGVVIGGIVATVALGTAGWIKYQGAVTKAAAELTAMGPAGAKAATALQNVATIGGKAVATLGALMLASAAVEAATGDTAPNIQALAAGLEKYTKTGQASGEMTRLFGDDLSGLDAALKTSADSSTHLKQQIASASLGLLEFKGAADVEHLQAWDQALASLVQSGDLDGAAAGYKVVADRAKELGISTDQLNALFPQYRGALESTSDATKVQAKRAAETTDVLTQLYGAFGEAASKANGLAEAYDVLNGKTLDLRGAQRDAEQAVDDFTAAIQESGGSMDITTEAGRRAQAAADALAESAINVAQKTYDQTGSVEAANEAYNNYIGQLKQTLANAGFTEGAINDLINTIARVPEYKHTTFVQDIITRHTSIGDPFRPYGGGVFERWGGVVHAATGRLVPAGIVSSPTVLFGERATGEEAFIPRIGNPVRSMGILRTAANWLNADVVPRGGYYAGSGGSAMRANTAPAAGATYVTNHITVRGLAELEEFLDFVDRLDNTSRQGIQVRR